jgi:hypothetical protein
MGVISDQQFASAIMKVGGTFLLWGIILVVFFRWSAEQERMDAMRRRASRLAAGAGVGSAPPERSAPESSTDILTWAQVEDELARTHPAQPES